MTEPRASRVATRVLLLGAARQEHVDVASVQIHDHNSHVAAVRFEPRTTARRDHADALCPGVSRRAAVVRLLVARYGRAVMVFGAGVLAVGLSATSPRRFWISRGWP